MTNQNSGNVVYHPEIADAFKPNYSQFCNLTDDPDTYQTSPNIINDFMVTLPLPQVDFQTLSKLN